MERETSRRVYVVREETDKKAVNIQARSLMARTLDQNGKKCQSVGVGAQLYIPRLLEIVERRPVYVRLALWFLHHPAWMESHTGGSRLTPTVHPCPV